MEATETPDVSEAMSAAVEEAICRFVELVIAGLNETEFSPEGIPTADASQPR